MQFQGGFLLIHRKSLVQSERECRSLCTFFHVLTLALRLAPQGVHSLVVRDGFSAVGDVEHVPHPLLLLTNLDQSFSLGLMRTGFNETFITFLLTLFSLNFDSLLLLFR